MGLTKALGVILFTALLFNSVQTAQSVTLRWDPIPDPTVTGYKVYYGAASRSYTNSIDAGSATNASITGLAQSVTYYFAVTAYTDTGMESDFSNEASYTVPARSPTVQISVTTNGQTALTVKGLIGHTCNVEATEDLKVWTVIGTVTLGDSGSLVFTDPNAASFPKRFYRTRDVQP